MGKKSRTCVLYSVLIIGIFFSCNKGYIEMPENLYGNWKSKCNHPDITLKLDSFGYCAVVHHRTYDGRTCSVRYPLHLTSRIRGIIHAEGAIIFCFDSLKQNLFLSPGGYYVRIGQ